MDRRSPTVKKHHRVVVQFLDMNYKCSAPLNESIKLWSDIKVLDKYSMLTRLVNSKQAENALQPRFYRHMEFDSVGHEHDTHIRNEVATVLTQLLVNNENCCMVRILPSRDMHINLLTRLLVADMDKKLSSIRGRVLAINLEYYDVRKFDVINLCGEHIATQQSASTLTQSNQPKKRTMEARRQFLTTRELFHWLRTDYITLRSHGTGDDYIDIEIVYVDGTQKMQRNKFALFQIYFQALDADARSELANFFTAIRTKKKYKPSMRTDCLKECFDPKNLVHTLFLFEIPLGKEWGLLIDEMLKVADAAYVGINMLRRSQAEAMSQPNMPKQKSTITLHFNPVKKISEPLSKSKNTSKMSFGYSEGPLKKEDFNSLSFWYNKIDDKYGHAISTMENYYKSIYKNKLNKICNEIKFIDQDIIGDPMMDLSTIKKEADVDLAHIQYTEALDNFRALEQELNLSSYAHTLLVYLETKNFELIQAENRMREKQVENCRLSVMSFIKEEDTSST